jgi:hypothetical protein
VWTPYYREFARDFLEVFCAFRRGTDAPRIPYLSRATAHGRLACHLGADFRDNNSCHLVLVPRDLLQSSGQAASTQDLPDRERRYIQGLTIWRRSAPRLAHTGVDARLDRED